MSITSSGTPACAAARRMLSASGASGPEPQQHEPAPEQIERGASVGQPRVRRTRARPRGLDIARGRKRRRRRAVGADDGRAVVAVTEVEAEREPLVPHRLGEPAPVLRARGVAGRPGLEDLGGRQALAGGEHAPEIRARFGDVAHGHRPALDFVGTQQRAAGPAAQGRLELPAEIDGILDAGVHAEAAGRRHQVRGIAGNEHPLRPVAVGDELAPHPPHHRQDLVVERAAHGARQRMADVGLGMGHLVGGADDRHAEALAAVDRHDGEPGALGPDEDETVGPSLVVQRGKVRAAQHHVGGVGQRGVAAHGDAGALAHQAGAAVGADEIVGRDVAGLAGGDVADLRDDTARGLLERRELGAVAQPHVRKGLHEAPQDRVEHVLRHALALLRALRRALLLRAPGEALAPELVAVEPGDIDAVLRIVAGIGRVAHPVRDAPAAAEFHGARADDVHPRLLDGAVGLLDQRAGNAAPAELAGEREPDRSGTDDQNRGALVHAGASTPAPRPAVSAR